MKKIQYESYKKLFERIFEGKSGLTSEELTRVLIEGGFDVKEVMKIKTEAFESVDL